MKALLANAPAQAETLLHNLECTAAGIGLYVNGHKKEYTSWQVHLPRKQCLINRDINMQRAKAWTAIDHIEVKPDR